MVAYFYGAAFAPFVVAQLTDNSLSSSSLTSLRSFSTFATSTPSSVSATTSNPLASVAYSDSIVDVSTFSETSTSLAISSPSSSSGPDNSSTDGGNPSLSLFPSLLTLSSSSSDLLAGSSSSSGVFGSTSSARSDAFPDFTNNVDSSFIFFSSTSLLPSSTSSASQPCESCFLSISEKTLTYPSEIEIQTVTATIFTSVTEYDNGTITNLVPFFMNDASAILSNANSTSSGLLTWTIGDLTLTYPTTYVSFGFSGEVITLVPPNEPIDGETISPSITLGPTNNTAFQCDIVSITVPETLQPDAFVFDVNEEEGPLASFVTNGSGTFGYFISLDGIEEQLRGQNYTDCALITVDTASEVLTLEKTTVAYLTEEPGPSTRIKVQNARQTGNDINGLQDGSEEEGDTTGNDNNDEEEGEGSDKTSEGEGESGDSSVENGEDNEENDSGQDLSSGGSGSGTGGEDSDGINESSDEPPPSSNDNDAFSGTDGSGNSDNIENSGSSSSNGANGDPSISSGDDDNNGGNNSNGSGGSSSGDDFVDGSSNDNENSSSNNINNNNENAGSNGGNGGIVNADEGDEPGSPADNDNGSSNNSENGSNDSVNNGNNSGGGGGSSSSDGDSNSNSDILIVDVGDESFTFIPLGEGSNEVDDSNDINISENSNDNVSIGSDDSISNSPGIANDNTSENIDIIGSNDDNGEDIDVIGQNVSGSNGGRASDGGDEDGFVIDNQIIRPGETVTINDVPVGLLPSGNSLVIDSTRTEPVAFASTPFGFNDDGDISSILAAPAGLFDVDSLIATISDSQLIVGQGTILTPGEVAIVDGTRVSLREDGSEVVVGTSTINVASISATAVLSPPAAVAGVPITVDSLTATISNSQLVIGPGTTLTAGEVATVDGTRVSLDNEGGMAVVGTSTVNFGSMFATAAITSLPPDDLLLLPTITILDSVIATISGTELIIGGGGAPGSGRTLTPGEVITLDRTPISLDEDGGSTVFVGTSVIDLATVPGVGVATATTTATGDVFAEGKDDDDDDSFSGQQASETPAVADGVSAAPAPINPMKSMRDTGWILALAFALLIGVSLI